MNITNAVRITIGEAVIEGLRVEALIKCTSARGFSTARVKIYGLSEQTYYGLVVDSESKIEALVDGNYALLFQGKFRLQQRYHESEEVISDLFMFERFEDASKKVKKTFEKDSTGSQVLEWFKGQAPGLEVVISEDMQSKIDALTFKSGYVVPEDRFIRALSDFIKNCVGGLEAIIDRGELYIGSQDNEPHEINAETGMIGIPTVTRTIDPPEGLSDTRGKVSVSLMHLLNSREKIKVNSKYFKMANFDRVAYSTGGEQAEYQVFESPVSGTYVVLDFSHQIDTHNGVWKTDITYIGSAK